MNYHLKATVSVWTSIVRVPEARNAGRSGYKFGASCASTKDSHDSKVVMIMNMKCIAHTVIHTHTCTCNMLTHMQ